jgi:hypothetical protein
MKSKVARSFGIPWGVLVKIKEQVSPFKRWFKAKDKAQEEEEEEEDSLDTNSKILGQEEFDD